MRESAKDIVLGYDKVSDYEENGTFFRAVGRGQTGQKAPDLCWMGQSITFRKMRENNLHSGPDSYAFRLWDCVKEEEDSVSFSSGQPGWRPGISGNFSITVTYTLTDQNELKIHYEGESDQTTIVNMTNHTLL